MVSSKDGHFMCEGSLSEIMADFTCCINGMRKFLTEQFGELDADKFITVAGKMAYKGKCTEEDIEEFAKEILG